MLLLSIPLLGSLFFFGEPRETATILIASDSKLPLTLIRVCFVIADGRMTRRTMRLDQIRSACIYPHRISCRKRVDYSIFRFKHDQTAVMHAIPYRIRKRAKHVQYVPYSIRENSDPSRISVCDIKTSPVTSSRVEHFREQINRIRPESAIIQ